MKLLLIAESEEVQSRVAQEFRPHQAEIIHYWSPLKGMDNLDEIAPDVVLFSAVDFPRHWKTFLTFQRTTYSRDRMVFVLLVGEEFDEGGASAAQHLGVNAVVDAGLADRADLNRLREIITRYKRLDESRSSHRHTPDELDDIDFLFSHPVQLRLVPGSVEDISVDGLRFVPHRPELVRDLKTGSRIKRCSLKVGEETVLVDCAVMRNTGGLGLAFENLSAETEEKIASYLENHTKRAIQEASSA
jgi:hypothetical protein